MKNLPLFIFFALLILILSCSKDEEHIPSVDSSTVKFRLTDLQDSNGQYQNVLIEADNKLYFQRPTFHDESEDSVTIYKRANFTLEGDGPYSPKNITIELHKKEAKNSLEYDSYFQKWKYKTLIDEYNLFYKSYDLARIDFQINSKYATIHIDRSSESFKINKISKVLVNDKEEWAIEAAFNGKAIQYLYSYISPPERSEVFEITDGRFAGVLN